MLMMTVAMVMMMVIVMAKMTLYRRDACGQIGYASGFCESTGYEYRGLWKPLEQKWLRRVKQTMNYRA